MSRTTKLLASLILLAALVAVGVSSYLAYESIRPGKMAGCTFESFDCDGALASSWSHWLGVPVAIIGGLVYLAIAAMVWPAAMNPRSASMSVLIALVTSAVGAGIWFTGLQFFDLEGLCLYCLITHACGLAIGAMTVALYFVAAADARSWTRVTSSASVPSFVGSRGDSGSSLSSLFGIVAGVVVVAVLVGVQLAIPSDMSKPMQEIDLQHVTRAKPPVEEKPSKAPDFMAEGSDDQEEKAPAAPSKPERLLNFAALASPLDTYAMPMLGNPDATYVVTEMLDYTCSHCRQLHPHLAAARERYGDQLAVVLYHVPLSADCNDHLPPGKRGRKEACEYARLAIGVWQLAPEKFPEYHNWLMQGRQAPSLGEAKQRAMQIAGDQLLLDNKLKKQITDRLRRQSDDWHTLKSGLPLLLFPESAVSGAGKGSAEVFKLLEDKLGVAPAADQPQ
ncbi:vitamin K epoxide reductase family protein [Aeoliella sp. SH292]|uniref:vitamin K epoxide reductase family protein n=1 Tax=Aeoliella sp. SH292 TaxID=3454464 RepID=UPI003F985979